MVNRLAGLVLGSLICTMASAQSLDDRVRDLERRIEQLEKQTSLPASIPSANKLGQQDGWRQRENWRSLKRGMTESNVRSILGEPQKVDTFSTWSSWTYPSGGNVRFGSGGGRVDGWVEPR